MRYCEWYLYWCTVHYCYYNNPKLNNNYYFMQDEFDAAIVTAADTGTPAIEEDTADINDADEEDW